MTLKDAREMNEAERQAALAEIKRRPLPEPMPPLDESASQQQRDEWLRDYLRRHR
jgi:hypothetical protein